MFKFSFRIAFICLLYHIYVDLISHVHNIINYLEIIQISEQPCNGNVKYTDINANANANAKRHKSNKRFVLSRIIPIIYYSILYYQESYLLFIIIWIYVIYLVSCCFRFFLLIQHFFNLLFDKHEFD